MTDDALVKQLRAWANDLKPATVMPFAAIDLYNVVLDIISGMEDVANDLEREQDHADLALNKAGWRAWAEQAATDRGTDEETQLILICEGWEYQHRLLREAQKVPGEESPVFEDMTLFELGEWIEQNITAPLEEVYTEEYRRAYTTVRDVLKEYGLGHTWGYFLPNGTRLNDEEFPCYKQAVDNLDHRLNDVLVQRISP